jgi:hypothetical protein
MFAKKRSITVAARAEAVYDYVSDIERHPEWARHKLIMKKTGEGRFESRAEVYHLEPTSQLRVETTDRPRRFTFLSDDQYAGTYRWYFDITPVDGGSLLTYGLERLSAPTVVKIVQPWLLWNTGGRQGLVTGLANIKRTLEAQTKRSAAPSAG